jgi:hypothetical protein
MTIVTRRHATKGAVAELSPGTLVCGGRFRLDEQLNGTPELGVWAGTEIDGGRAVIVSIAPYADAPAEELALDVPGVPTLLAVGDAPGGRTAVVDERPAGAIADPGPDGAAALAADVAALAAFVHHMGLALGGIRPEAVWVDGEVSVAPRLTRLWELSRQSFEAPGGPDVFISLGRLRGSGPTPADDVFALGATLAWWATGEHPFEGGTRAEQVQAIQDRRRRPWTGDPVLAPIVDAALAPPRERPGMEAIESALRQLG